MYTFNFWRFRCLVDLVYFLATTARAVCYWVQPWTPKWRQLGHQQNEIKISTVHKISLLSYYWIFLGYFWKCWLEFECLVLTNTIKRYPCNIYLFLSLIIQWNSYLVTRIFVRYKAQVMVYILGKLSHTCLNVNQTLIFCGSGKTWQRFHNVQNMPKSPSY